MCVFLNKVNAILFRHNLPTLLQKNNSVFFFLKLLNFPLTLNFQGNNWIALDYFLRCIKFASVDFNEETKFGNFLQENLQEKEASNQRISTC